MDTQTIQALLETAICQATEQTRKVFRSSIDELTNVV